MKVFFNRFTLPFIRQHLIKLEESPRRTNFIRTVPQIEMKYLNVGCGSRFHSEWINLDSRPSHPDIQFHDLREGIPFTDNSFEVVYHSHVLEHLRKTQAPFF